MYIWSHNKSTSHSNVAEEIPENFFYSGPKWLIDFRKSRDCRSTVCGGELHYRLMHYTVFEITLHVMTYVDFALLPSRSLRGIPLSLSQNQEYCRTFADCLLTRRQIAHFIFTHRHTRMHIGRFYKRNMRSLNASGINKCLKIRCT